VPGRHQPEPERHRQRQGRDLDDRAVREVPDDASGVREDEGKSGYEQRFAALDAKFEQKTAAWAEKLAPLKGQRVVVYHKSWIYLLDWVGLHDHMDARPPTLSGGQQQRLAIARAVIARPKLLLADEPTGNVDDQMAMRLMHLFDELNKLGTTVVIATHNETLVKRLGHSVLRLDEGRLDIHPGEAA